MNRDKINIMKFLLVRSLNDGHFDVRFGFPVIQMRVTRGNLALLTLIHYAEYASF